MGSSQTHDTDRMDHRTATAEWERQREREARRSSTSTSHWEDFVDTDGRAERYFRANRERIVRHLTGQEDTTDNQSGTYAAWEQWARQQWEQSQQQQQQQRSYEQARHHTRSRQSSRSRSGAKAKKEYQWDFNPHDPYVSTSWQLWLPLSQILIVVNYIFDRLQVLRVGNSTRRNRHASLECISTTNAVGRTVPTHADSHPLFLVFSLCSCRRHHPDTKANASKAVQDRAIERSKLITNAYQTIKAEMKR